MANFSHTGSGGILLIGCAGPNRGTINIDTLFNAGDFVWIKQKAKRGILERVNIERINSVGSLLYNYQDTFNRLWLENELCDLETAQQLVRDYQERVNAAHLAALKNCKAEIG